MGYIFIWINLTCWSFACCCEFRLPPRPLSEMFPSASVEALDLLRLCLQWDASELRVFCCAQRGLGTSGQEKRRDHRNHCLKNPTGFCLDTWRAVCLYVNVSNYIYIFFTYYIRPKMQHSPFAAEQSGLPLQRVDVVIVVGCTRIPRFNPNKRITAKDALRHPCPVGVKLRKKNPSKSLRFVPLGWKKTGRLSYVGFDAIFPISLSGFKQKSQVRCAISQSGWRIRLRSQGSLDGLGMGSGEKPGETSR